MTTTNDPARLAEEAKRKMIDFAEEVWQAGTEGWNTNTVAPCREARAKAEAAIDALASLAQASAEEARDAERWRALSELPGWGKLPALVDAALTAARAVNQGRDAA